MTDHTNTTARRGITLIEVTVSTLLVGLVMVSALACAGAATQSWNTTADFADGTALALELRGEITAQYYQDPAPGPVFGPETGETSTPSVRTNFDDVDDYLDLNDTPPKVSKRHATQPIQRLATNGRRSKAEHEQLRRVARSDGGHWTQSDHCDGGISVGENDPLKTYRSSIGGGLKTQGVAQTLVTWGGFDMQTGNTAQMSSGAALNNHAADQ